MPLCSGAGELARAEVLDRLGVKDLDSVDIEPAKSFPAFFEEQNLISHGQENVKALKVSKSPLGHKERDKDEAPGIQVTVIGWAAQHEVAMNNRPLASGVVLLLLSALQPVASVGTISEQIDSGHSTASLTVGPLAGGRQWNVGIAKVSGTMQWNDGDITKSVLDLTIYPAGQGARLLNPDGRLRSYTSAALSRYTVMTFGSVHAELDQSGKPIRPGTMPIRVPSIERPSRTVRLGKSCSPWRTPDKGRC